MFIKSSGVCVYVHRTGEQVLYVGKGVSSRPFERTRRNEKWHEAVAANGGFDVEIVAWFDSDAAALLFEAELIQKLAPTSNLMMNGWKRSAEFCAMVSAIHKGKIVSGETREKMRVAMTGKTHTEETRQRLREANKGVVPWNKGLALPGTNKSRMHPIREVETGVIYESVAQASRVLDIPKATLLQHMRGKLRHARGRVFERHV